MPDAMKKYAVNTSILVSKRMLDGGIPAANDFFIASGICCLMWHLVLTVFISQGA
jgi:hypothetical protein